MLDSDVCLGVAMRPVMILCVVSVGFSFWFSMLWVFIFIRFVRTVNGIASE